MKVPSEQFFISVQGSPLPFLKKRGGVGRNDEKILEHQLGRDAEGRGSFGPWY